MYDFDFDGYERREQLLRNLPQECELAWLQPDKNQYERDSDYNNCMMY